jgi:hypothetical protein
MYIPEAVDVIREKLVQHRLSGRKTLWSTILKQIAKKDAIDGHFAETILAIIRSFLKELDDKTAISLWRNTEAGWADDAQDDHLLPFSVRMDLEMELLQEITNLAWEEAKELR